MFRRILSSIGLGASEALDPDAFTLLARDIFQKRAPDHKIEIAGQLQLTITPPGDSPQTVFLDNLYKACCANLKSLAT